MALKKTVTDPLNWLLLLLAAAFVYYIFAVPYFTEFYLKTPQEMTLEDYLGNPSHPRPFMLHALSQPPSSIEVVLTDLTVAHIDQDSILLRGDLSGVAPTAEAAAESTPAEDAGGDAADDAAEPTEEMEAEEPAAVDDEAEAMIEYVAETDAPNDEILLAGDNLDLLGVTVGQTVSLRVHALHRSPLGWIPQEITVDQDQEEYFNKDELDALEMMTILADGNPIDIPYVEVGEFRFANGSLPSGEPVGLDELSDDTTYVQTAQRLGGAPLDLTGVRLVERLMLDRSPYFVVEDDEGRRARVFYNSRLLSEWYWALDRLQGEEIIVRGSLRLLAPSELRQLESESNVQVVLDGYELLSRDGDQAGATIISLENSLGGGGLGAAQ